ncbi:MAG TPA: HEPN domain-containing protein [Solirubrobacteraceae bacterium]|nr:HEPN domain-containing protein [Solirubrobacteraceae bacterium]
MSPRSDEFLVAAKRRLASAEMLVEEDPSGALSAAYYAMLYAARAALSERETSARTHRGTWHEFREAFVASGEIDEALTTEAQKFQPEREQADYEAWFAPVEEAQRAIMVAHRFLKAVEALFDES